MSQDLIFGDKWFVVAAIAAGGVFLIDKVGADRFGELVTSIDRVLYGLL